MTVLQCEVCGAASSSLVVRQSNLPLPTSPAYCPDCLRQGLEPLKLVKDFLAIPLDERIDVDPAYGGPRNADEIATRSLEFHARRQQ